ncbi:helix-turn-helix transcriptional regulator [Solirubrobacter phytolaccae]|uniref:Helix-turn-helix transcriptional regulator n=1 Tax=Solirubrobacter phytolaccae TaxID=1404360 RepID=A0A9X3NAE5_9ACTN|nr:helix-turn-helix transcriptional regulator [Solirubrobacter phytolaccae]MDA0182833.1 helix-turn-helix transcriptional regulator [Solirubrobacter phytolaccae]
MDDGNRLGEFLRARRERVLPGDVGLREDDGTRRVPGLRREELAQLAGVSTNYVVRLEQGRDRHPSPSVLDALAKALQLDEAATAHLHQLGTPAAERPRARGRAPREDAVAPGVQLLLERLADQPVSVMNRFGDILATTPLAAALMPGLTTGTNAYRATFLDPAVRELFGDGWDRIARSVVAGLRAVSADAAGDPRLVALVGELALESDVFRRLWARHDVRPRVGRGTTVLQHPQVGAVELGWEKLEISGSPGQTLVIHHAEPGSASEHALALLASLAAKAPPHTHVSA